MLAEVKLSTGAQHPCHFVNTRMTVGMVHGVKMLRGSVDGLVSERRVLAVAADELDRHR